MVAAASFPPAHFPPSTGGKAGSTESGECGNPNETGDYRMRNHGPMDKAAEYYQGEMESAPVFPM